MADPNALGDFIVNAPLYTRRELDVHITVFKEEHSPETSTHNILCPKSVRRHCGTEQCGKVMTFDKIGREQDFLNSAYTHQVTFKCRHCREGFAVWFAWKPANGKVLIEKYGEMPRPDIALPLELAKALKKHSVFWRRGMSLRHHGAGIGALAYFRRIVEATTDDLLELLAKAMELAEDPKPDIDAIRQLTRERTTYDRKAEVASRVLPARYRQGGNPLKAMFEVMSDGMHARTDEDCCALADGLREAMTFLLPRLNEDISSPKGLVDALKALESLRKKDGEK